MAKANWRQFALLLGSLFLLLCPTVALYGGEDEKEAGKKVEAEEDKRVEEFNEFEAEIKGEIERREENAGRGEEVLTAYREELIAEYHQNVARLAELHPEENLERAPLEKRQKVIALYLWELERLEPAVKAKAISCDDLRGRVRNELSKLQRNRGDDIGKDLQQRCQDLYRKLSELEHRRHINPAMVMRRARNGFYEVRPESEVGDQDNTIDADGSLKFASGDIQELRRPLRRLLKLRWAGSSLSLDREHWNDLFAGKSLEDVAADVRKVFKDREADLSQASPHRHPTTSQPKIVLLFQNLHNFAANSGQGGGASSSGGGRSWRQTFETSEISARMSANQDSLDLEIKEIKSPERSLRVLSRNDSTLRIILIGDRMLYLEQRGNGRVRLLEVYEDEMLHASGDSFLEIYSKHPDFVEVSLLPLLEHLGFIVPETRFSPRVRRRVVELAGIVKADRVTAFQAVLRDLDSASFSIRERAGRELEEQQDLYVDLVQEAYRNNELPLEVRTRLKRVLHQYERGPRHLDEFIAGMKMLDDPRYLANLMPKLSEQDRAVVAERLQTLTGETLGTDVDAWQAWLQRS